MIRYALVCDASHEFEGWFAASSDFDSQSDRGLIECPVCASHIVRKQIMSPSVAGAKKIAIERLRIFPETHYFSFHGNTTFTNPRTGYALPMAATNPLLVMDAAMIGRTTNDPSIPAAEESAWWPSDGLVSCVGGQNVLEIGRASCRERV